MKILDDNFMVCVDCILAIANGDYSGLDYSLPESEADRRMEEIEQGIDAAGGYDGYIVPGDAEKEEEFSSSDCDCCGSHLAGSRHHCVILGSQQ